MSNTTEGMENNTTNNDSIEVMIEKNLQRFSTFVRELSGTTQETQATPQEQDTQGQDGILSEPLVILGTKFTNLAEAEEYIQSKLWLSYRCGFDPIVKDPDGPTPMSFLPSMIFNKSVFTSVNWRRSLFDYDNFNSDVGWGCMIRTTQTLLANTLVKLQQDADEERIIGLFQDNLNCVFSIHNFIRVASKSPLEVKPGQWFGPNAASLSIKKLLDQIKPKAIEGVDLPKVFISENSDLYDEEIETNLENSSLLILFPVRLGIDNVNSYYYSSIFQLLSSDFTMGISGGKPSSSFYFLGYQNQDLIYLDPHLPQLYQPTAIDYQTYHCANYNRLNINMLDPSMMIGVLLRDKLEYKQFKRECIEENNKIVHFHPQLSPSLEGVNQSWEVVEEEDDFVNLGRVEEDEFVDLTK
ncbi:Cysteine protease ATG4 [Spathaspora sp. JA1]|nr:Cysteine protease ATG4 [Spathaspora sp. JA1]